MKWQYWAEIEDQGEEAGREEAACALPGIPRLSTFSSEQYTTYRRVLTRKGRAHAQGLYALRGKSARIFAHQWAMGYLANCDLFEREGHLDLDEEAV